MSHRIKSGLLAVMKASDLPLGLALLALDDVTVAVTSAGTYIDIYAYIRWMMSHVLRPPPPPQCSQVDPDDGD